MKYQELKFQNNAKFLVTGGAGFIGSNICEALLAMGQKVCCLDDFSTGKQKNIEPFMGHPNFTLIEGDIRSLDTCKRACEGMTYVSHQAAWGSVPRSIEYPVLYEEINIKGTLNMLEAARQSGVLRFAYASSSSVYGDEPNLPKKEGKEGNLLSPYALTKRANEEYAKLYHRLYGLETVGFRYFNVFGRRQDPDGYYAAVIPRFVKALIDNETPVIYGDGQQSRDFTYVENVVEANLKAMVAPQEAAGQAYNIAYGEQITLLDLYDKLCELLGKNIRPQFIEERAGDIKHSLADISKAQRLLGYDPQWDFGQGFTAAVDWYKQNLK